MAKVSWVFWPWKDHQVWEKEHGVNLKMNFSKHALIFTEKENGTLFLREQVHFYIFFHCSFIACGWKWFNHITETSIYFMILWVKCWCVWYVGLNRCRKSCRLRWLNYLKPNIKRGDFSEDEVDLIIRLHKLLGNRFVCLCYMLLI